jgi:hypothetical protein
LTRTNLELAQEKLRKQRLTTTVSATRNGKQLLQKLIHQRFSTKPDQVPVLLHTFKPETMRLAGDIRPAGLDIVIEPKVLDPFFKAGQPLISDRAVAIEALKNHENSQRAYVDLLPIEFGPQAAVHLASVKRFHDFLLGNDQLVSSMNRRSRNFSPQQINEIFDTAVLNFSNGQFSPNFPERLPLLDAVQASQLMQAEINAIRMESIASPPKPSAAATSSSGASGGKGKSQAAANKSPTKGAKNSNKAKSAAASSKSAGNSGGTSPTKSKALSLPASARAALSDQGNLRADAIRDYLKASKIPDERSCCRNFQSIGSAACAGPPSCKRPHECPFCPGKLVHSVFEADDAKHPEHPKFPSK